MRFKQITHTLYRSEEPSPSETFVSLDFVKTHARLPADITDEDQLLLSYLRTAERLVETQAEIALRNQEWTLRLECIPSNSAVMTATHTGVRLEIVPVRKIVSVAYWNHQDIETDLPIDAYQFVPEHTPPVVLLPNDLNLNLSSKVALPIKIRFRCGWVETLGDGEVLVPPQPPEEARLAICELVAYWYRYREAAGSIPGSLSQDTGRIFHDLIDAVSWKLL